MKEYGRQKKQKRIIARFYFVKANCPYASYEVCIIVIYIPRISDKESSTCHVFNCTFWQQKRLWYLQSMLGYCGTKADFKAATFSLKLNAVFILQMSQRKQERQKDKLLKTILFSI